MDEHIVALLELRAVVEFEEAAEIMFTFADLGHHEESSTAFCQGCNITPGGHVSLW